MILGMSMGNDFRDRKENIIHFKYKIGIKLIGFDYNLQEIFLNADLIKGLRLSSFFVL